MSVASIDDNITCTCADTSRLPAVGGGVGGGGGGTNAGMDYWNCLKIKPPGSIGAHHVIGHSCSLDWRGS